jgi:hypothetical protein
MTVHVQPHDHVENEAAWTAAAKAQIEGRAAAKKRREFLAANPDGEAIVSFIEQKAFAWATDAELYRAGDNVKNLEPRTFFDKLYLSIEKWGAPTQGQVDAVRRIIDQENSKKAEWAARDARSAYIGAIGDKIEIEAVIYFQTGFSNQWGYTTITGFRSGDNIIIHKGAAPAGEKGDRVILKATIKEHSDRNGVKQTIVTRPKTKLVEA